MKANSTVSAAELRDIEKNKDIAAFSYTLIFAPVLIVSRRDSAFIRHHARQALYLGFFAVIFMLLPGKLSYLNLLIVAAAVMGFLEAQSGNWYQIPGVSDLIKRNINLRSVWQTLKNGFRSMTKTMRQTVRKDTEPENDVPSENLQKRIRELEARLAELEKQKG